MWLYWCTHIHWIKTFTDKNRTVLWLHRCSTTTICVFLWNTGIWLCCFCFKPSAECLSHTMLLTVQYANCVYSKAITFNDWISNSIHWVAWRRNSLENAMQIGCVIQASFLRVTVQKLVEYASVKHLHKVNWSMSVHVLSEHNSTQRPNLVKSPQRCSLSS